ncbi:hypothetical protein [Achromobacter sp. AONIH1]|nr:hypothetical protein [Achromobacter sp. AONIH1]
MDGIYQKKTDSIVARADEKVPPRGDGQRQGWSGLRDGLNEKAAWPGQAA